MICTSESAARACWMASGPRSGKPSAPPERTFSAHGLVLCAHTGWLYLKLQHSAPAAPSAVMRAAPSRAPTHPCLLTHTHAPMHALTTQHTHSRASTQPCLCTHARTHTPTSHTQHTHSRASTHAPTLASTHATPPFPLQQSTQSTPIITPVHAPTHAWPSYADPAQCLCMHPQQGTHPCSHKAPGPPAEHIQQRSFSIMGTIPGKAPTQCLTVHPHTHPCMHAPTQPTAVPPYAQQRTASLTCRGGCPGQAAGGAAAAEVGGGADAPAGGGGMRPQGVATLPGGGAAIGAAAAGGGIGAGAGGAAAAAAAAAALAAAAAAATWGGAVRVTKGRCVGSCEGGL